jgi:predicted PurR-regulated permease PerM
MKKYVFFALFLVASGLFISMLWPFATVILLSLALTSVFTPLYQWFNRRITRGIGWVAALLTVICFILILCVPIFVIGSAVFTQSQNLTQWVVENGGVDKVTTAINQLISRFFPASIDVSSNISTLVARATSGIGSIFTATIATIFSLLLVALCMFYLLKDGKQWKGMFVNISPLSDSSSNQIIQKLRLAANGIIKGYLLIAVAQGLLMGFGMYVFGIPHAALWGVVAGVASLIPTIGTSLVSLPAIIFLVAVGRDAAAVGFALWAALLVGTLDNFLNPLIVGRSIDIHPLLVLFAVLGGIALMGPVGILIGPLVVSFIYALMSVYKTEMA